MRSMMLSFILCALFVPLCARQGDGACMIGRVRAAGTEGRVARPCGLAFAVFTLQSLVNLALYLTFL